MVRVRFQAQAMFWLVTAPARFLPVELGEGGRETVGTFARLVARYGTKNVPTHVEIIAELPARHAGAVTNRGPGSNTTVRPLAEPALYGLQGVRALIAQVHVPCCGQAAIDGNQEGRNEPKQTDVRINIAKEQPRFELLPTLLGPLARSYVVPQPQRRRILGRASLKCGGDDAFGPDARPTNPLLYSTFRDKHLSAGTRRTSSRRSTLQVSRLPWMRRLPGPFGDLWHPARA